MYPVHVHCCYCCALLDCLYCGGCISTSGKLVVLIPGGAKAYHPKGIGVHCRSWAATRRLKVVFPGDLSYVGEH